MGRKKKEKLCPDCGETKDITEFYGGKQVSHFCRICTKAKHKADYKKNKRPPPVKRCSCGEPARIKGLCGSCYHKSWYKNNTPKAKNYQLKYQRQIRRVNKKEDCPQFKESSLRYGVVHYNVSKMTPEQIVRDWDIIVMAYQPMKTFKGRV